MALELDPDLLQAEENATLLYQSARQAEGSGDLPKAVEFYEQALKALPVTSGRRVSFLGAYAGVLCILGRYEASLAHIKEALELDKSYAMGHARLGIILYVKGDFEEAMKSFQNALALRPGQEKWEKMLEEATAKVERYNKQAVAPATPVQKDGAVTKEGESAPVAEPESQPVPPKQQQQPQQQQQEPLTVHHGRSVPEQQDSPTTTEEDVTDNGPHDLVSQSSDCSDLGSTANSPLPGDRLPKDKTTPGTGGLSPAGKAPRRAGNSPPPRPPSGDYSGKKLGRIAGIFPPSGRKGEKPRSFDKAETRVKKEGTTLFRTQSDRGKRFGKLFGSSSSDKGSDDGDSVNGNSNDMRRTLSGSDLLHTPDAPIDGSKAARILGASATEQKLSKAAQILGVSDSRLLASHQGHPERRDSVPEAAERLEKIAQLLGFDDMDDMEKKEKNRFVFSLGTMDFSRISSRKGSKELMKNTT